MFFINFLTNLSLTCHIFRRTKISRINRYFIRKSSTVDTPPWREAASLIIISKLPTSKLKDVNSCNYNLLMVKRSKSSSFYANAYVFPGGQLELSDFSPQWWNIFEASGVSRTEILNFANYIQGPRPSMISDSMTLKYADIRGETLIPTSIALRITAIRETFEEIGLLFLKQKENNHDSFSTLNNKDVWQNRIRNDPNQFLQLCLSLNQCPDIWSLFEWSNWLTPQADTPKRYDTMFYVHYLSNQPDICLDKNELTVKKWCSPEVVLDVVDSRDFYLPPPQVYELSRLQTYKSFNDLKKFAQAREVLGCQRFLLILKQAADGVIALLPGDDDYGLDLQQDQDPLTVEAMRRGIKNLHRLEFTLQTFILQCNITPANGHILPHINRVSS